MLKQIKILLLARLTAPRRRSAQSVEFKVGFVSTERLFREAAPAVRALKKLEKEFAPRDQELQKLAKQAKDLQTQLEKDGVTMAESERRNKEAGPRPHQPRSAAPAARVSRGLEPAQERGAGASAGARQQGHSGDRRKRKVRSHPAGSGVPQPAHRHHRQGVEGAGRTSSKACITSRGCIGSCGRACWL